VALQQRGVLVGSVLNSQGTIRVTPPLIITPAEIDVFIGVLRAVLAERAGIRVDDGHDDHDH
jgi:4-aminobutyrate aminotransferase-like enzyme